MNGRIPPLARLPTNSFGVALGLGGQAILWKNLSASGAEAFAGISSVPHSLLWLSCVVVFSTLLLGYAVNLLTPPFSLEHCCLAVPHIALLMIALGLPPRIESVHFQRAAWLVGFTVQGSCLAAQLKLCFAALTRWVSVSDKSLANARSTILLSTISWFLLAVLGQQSGINDAWQLGLTGFVLGLGVVLYSLCLVGIFMSLHTYDHSESELGQPSLFMLIAPPSVAAVAFEGEQGSFGALSVRAPSPNPHILDALPFNSCSKGASSGPPLLTSDHAFHTSNLMSLVLMAALLLWLCVTRHRLRSTRQVAMAMVAFVFAIFKLSWHHLQVMRNLSVWEDPVAGKFFEDQQRRVDTRAIAESGTNDD
ncbi:MAG: hypothetical protein SGPRY_000861 [Prymnesium sp.]